MDTNAAVAGLNTWLDLLYEIHRAHSDPAEGASQRSRVKTELLPFYLDEASWDGDAPFERFTNQLKPSVATKNKPAQLAQLGRRQLFKAESWSAPDVSGIARCLVGQAHAEFATFPELVFDLAEVAGSPRIVAMHTTCPKCQATGTVGGAVCTHTDRGGVPCVDGLLSMGGLAFDPGEHTGSRRLQEVPHDTWRAYMDR
jgi:hypothetical protein